MNNYMVMIEIGVVALIILVELFVETTKINNRIRKIDTRLINMQNRVRGLPPLTVEEREMLEYIMEDLNNGNGFLDLSGHIDSDKARIELLKQIISAYIMRSAEKYTDIRIEDRVPLNPRSTNLMNKIMENAKFILIAQDFSRLID